MAGHTPTKDQESLEKQNSVSAPDITLADNSWRLRKFHTRTVLAEESGKKVIYKCAATKEAVPFIKNIVEVERINSQYLRGQFDILFGRLRGDHIEYEHLRHPSLSHIIASELRQKHCERADELLRCYTQKIRALNSVKTCPKEFLSIIGQNAIGNSNPEVSCLSRGLLDLTPRNILVDSDKWMVVDNEWSFDFPIPVAFILFRAILELATRLQDEIRSTTTKTRPAVGLLRRGLQTLYFPENWYGYISDTRIGFAQMLRWEMGFQRYITGFKGKITGYTEIKNPRIKSSLSTRVLRIKKGVQNLIRSIKQLPGVRWFVHLL